MLTTLTVPHLDRRYSVGAVENLSITALPTNTIHGAVPFLIYFSESQE